MKKLALLMVSAAALLMVAGCAYDDYDYHGHHNRGDWHHGDHDGDGDHDGGGHHHRHHDH